MKTCTNYKVAIAAFCVTCTAALAQSWQDFAHPWAPHSAGTILPDIVFEDLFADEDAVLEIPIVVVLLEFSDETHNPDNSTAYFQDMFFGDGDPNPTVADFYNQTSNGRIQLVPVNETHGTVNDGIVGWIEAQNGDSEFNNDGGKKRAEAIRRADDYMSFAQYDDDNDGMIEPHELIVYVINPGNSTGGSTTSTDPKIVDVDGGGMLVRLPVGALTEVGLASVHAHETAHPFFGLSDLYAKCDPDAAANWRIGDGYICNTLSDACLFPDNETCSCPTALDVDPSDSTIADTSGYDLSSAPACGDADAVLGPTAWYEVYGNGNTFTATTCHDWTNFDTQISVYCNGCDGLTCVAGNDDAGAANCVIDSDQSTVSWCTEPDVSYLIAVHGTLGSSGVLVIDVSEDGMACEPTTSCGLAAAHSRHWYPYTPQFMGIMSSGWNSQAATVVPLDPWSKIHMGLTKPKIITRDGTYTVHAAEPVRDINQQETEPEAFIIYDPQAPATSAYKQYFIIEARNQPGLGDRGLAVWLINEEFGAPLQCMGDFDFEGDWCTDDTECGSGTCTRTPNLRRIMRLVHQGGHNPDWDDFLWDSSEGDYYDLTPTSVPRNSAWADGRPSFVEITHMSPAGDTITFNVKIPPIFVDINSNAGSFTGSQDTPYLFVEDAVNDVNPGPRSIKIAGGVYPLFLFPTTIETPCEITSWKNGDAHIGG